MRLGVVVAMAAMALGAAHASAAGEPMAESSEGAREVSGRSGAALVATVVPADIEDVEHMCALLTSCDRLTLPAGLVPKDFATCTRTLYAELASPAALSFSLTLRECGLRASSCGELRSCALRGARAEVCAGRGKTSPVELCDTEGRAITCTQERVSLVRDCPRGGEQCAVRDGHAMCTLGACEEDAPPSCSTSGTRVLECKKGKLLSLDCAAFGLKCAPSSEGPRCVPPSAPCKDESAARCDGASAITCWRGHEVRVDCGARGLTCGGRDTRDADAGDDARAASTASAASSPIGACTAKHVGADACDPRTPPRCDGATLRWCAWGEPRAYLCKSVGLQRCIVDARGARCAP